jgi:sugar phosphate isomerase/epimerase
MDIVLPELVDTTAAAAREVLDRAGVAPGPASLPVEFRLDEETFRRDFAELPSTAALAAAIGVKTMFRSLPASSHVPAAELLPTLRRRISACANILHEHDIDFALEVLGPLHRRLEGRHEIIWRMSDGADFAQSCDANVGLLVDSWHWHHAGETPQDIVNVRNTIRHVHVADAADIPDHAVRDDQRLLPGDGVVDFKGFVAGLTAAGYSGFISPEVRGYRCSADSVACARAALHAVCSCLDAPSDGVGADGLDSA